MKSHRHINRGIAVYTFKNKGLAAHGVLQALVAVGGMAACLVAFPQLYNRSDGWQSSGRHAPSTGQKQNANWTY